MARFGNDWRNGCLMKNTPSFPGVLFALLLTGHLPAIAGEVPAKPAIYDLSGNQVAAGSQVNEMGRIENVAAPVVRLIPSNHPSPRGWFMLFPGGGYKRLSAVKEGTATAAFLNDLGYHVALLEYRINHGKETREMALEDAIAAWLMFSERAADFGFTKPGAKTTTGMIGYSAGGHLAARSMMHLSPGQHPDQLVLIYPAYLDQKNASTNQPLVTPPDATSTRLFISFAANDRAQWIAGAQAYADAWQAKGGSAEFHEFDAGGHGFGITDTNNPAVTGTHQVLLPFLKR